MTRRLLVSLVALTSALPPEAMAQEAPPPTPVPPYGSPSPYPTALETPAEPGRRPVRLDVAAAALADLDGGGSLLEVRGGARRPIASVTKIMTALLVLEGSASTDRVVVSEAAAAQEGAELGLEEGERIAVRELLYALMLQSSNDAAVALAEHVAGSVEAFVRRMNERAKELGAVDTRFHSPNGLDDRGRSTPRDLVAITRAAFGHPTFAEVVATRTRTIPAPNGPPRRIQSRNALLWLYPGAVGVKTGYTAAAGFCIVAAAERDGMRLLAVVLGDEDEVFSEAAALLEHGFAAFEHRELLAAGEPLAAISVQGRQVPVEAGGEVSRVLPAEGVGSVERTAAPRAGLRLPIRSGEELGEVIVTVDGEEVARVPLVAAADARLAPPPRPVAGPSPLFPVAAALLGAVLLGIVLLALRRRR